MVMVSPHVDIIIILFSFIIIFESLIDGGEVGRIFYKN